MSISHIDRRSWTHGRFSWLRNLPPDRNEALEFIRLRLPLAEFETVKHGTDAELIALAQSKGFHR